MGNDPVILTRGLAKRYGRTTALRGLDLEVRRGEVFGYLGPNGAGKTTTLRLLMGLLRPTAGRAAILGIDACRDPVAVHHHVGYLSGEPALYGRLTGAQHVEYFSHLRARHAAAVAQRLAGRFDLELDRPAGTLSKGNRQKLALVLAMMSEPEVLILDEPTGGLDPLAQQEFQALVRERAAAGGAVLLSSHVLSEVQRVADRVGVLRGGDLVAVDRVDVLLSRSLHRVQATFADVPSPEELGCVSGLRDVVLSDHTLTCSAPESALDHLLKVVSRHQVRDFSCAEAELEDTFLAYYAREGRRAA